MLIVFLLSVALAASAPVSELEPYQRVIVDFAFKELAKDWGGGDCKLRVATMDKFVQLAVDNVLYMLDLTLVLREDNPASCPTSSPRSISVEVWDKGDERRFLGVPHRVEKLSAEHHDVVGFALAKLAEEAEDLTRGCQFLGEENFSKIYSGGSLYGFDLVLQCDGEPEDRCHMKVQVTPQGNRSYLSHLSSCELTLFLMGGNWG